MSPRYTPPLTVNDIIAELSALPEDVKAMPVYIFNMCAKLYPATSPVVSVRKAGDYRFGGPNWDYFPTGETRIVVIE